MTTALRQFSVQNSTVIHNLAIQGALHSRTLFSRMVSVEDSVETNLPPNLPALPAKTEDKNSISDLLRMDIDALIKFHKRFKNGVLEHRLFKPVSGRPGSFDPAGWSVCQAGPGSRGGIRLASRRIYWACGRQGSSCLQVGAIRVRSGHNGCPTHWAR